MSKALSVALGILFFEARCLEAWVSPVKKELLLFLTNTVQLLYFSGVYNSWDLVLEVWDQCCHWWTVCCGLRSCDVFSWGLDVQDAKESVGKYQLL